MPAWFSQPDQVAAKTEKRFLRWTWWLLILNVAAAGAGAAGSVTGWGSRAAVVAMVAFAIALFLGGRLAYENPKRGWYDLRAAAESAKTLAIQYAVGGGMFGKEHADAQDEYRRAVESIPRALPNLPPLGVLGDPVTVGLDAVRGRSLEERRNVYLTERVQDQQRWYARKATYNSSAADKWRNVMFGSQALGLIAAGARAMDAIHVNLLGIAAALTAAAAAWLRTKDHEGLSEAYKVTAQELFEVARSGRAIADEEAWAEYVADAEAAFSREHTLWLARRG